MDHPLIHRCHEAVGVDSSHDSPEPSSATPPAVVTAELVGAAAEIAGASNVNVRPDDPWCAAMVREKRMAAAPAEGAERKERHVADVGDSQLEVKQTVEPRLAVGVRSKAPKLRPCSESRARPLSGKLWLEAAESTGPSNVKRPAEQPTS